MIFSVIFRFLQFRLFLKKKLLRNVFSLFMKSNETLFNYLFRCKYLFEYLLVFVHIMGFVRNKVLLKHLCLFKLELKSNNVDMHKFEFYFLLE